MSSNETTIIDINYLYKPSSFKLSSDCIVSSAIQAKQHRICTNSNPNNARPYILPTLPKPHINFDDLRTANLLSFVHGHLQPLSTSITSTTKQKEKSFFKHCPLMHVKAIKPDSKLGVGPQTKTTLVRKARHTRKCLLAAVVAGIFFCMVIGVAIFLGVYLPHKNGGST